VSDDDALVIGSVLDGRYRIDGVLGTGGMGRVYAAEHVGLGRPVAIKVLHADMNKNREAAQRFQREALASGRLEHPNIVNVSDFGTLESGDCFLVMEQLDGQSLGEHLELHGPLPWQDALAFMRGILLGLKHAHDRGVVHRDIKPDNIFLASKDGELVVKILDFGIAKLYAGDANDPAATSAGLTVGTPAYLSPEQAVGGEITPRSDLYSATCLLFEMVAGRPPFDGADPLALLGAHIGRPAPRVGDVAPTVAIPPALEDLIAAGLVKAQAERIQTAEDYLARLDTLVAPPPRAATPVPFASRAPSVEELGTAPTGYLAPVSKVELPVAHGAGTVALPSSPMLSARNMKIGRITLAIGAVVALVIVLSTARSNRSPAALETSMTKPDAPPPKATPPAKVTPPKATPPAKVTPTPTPKVTPPPPAKMTTPNMTPAPTRDDAALEAALATLAGGKTCKARKAAIPTLVALGDPRAIEPLKKARRRMTGGIFGLGQSNSNSCLKTAAEDAIVALGGTLK
jgi:eukaryotic-like serine/threonine-protein kinase